MEAVKAFRQPPVALASVYVVKAHRTIQGFGGGVCVFVMLSGEDRKLVAVVDGFENAAEDVNGDDVRRSWRLDIDVEDLEKRPNGGIFGFREHEDQDGSNENNYWPLPKPKIPPIANSAHSPFLTKKTPDSALDLVLLILPFVNTMMLFEDSRIVQNYYGKFVNQSLKEQNLLLQLVLQMQQLLHCCAGRTPLPVSHQHDDQEDAPEPHCLLIFLLQLPVLKKKLPILPTPNENENDNHSKSKSQSNIPQSLEHTAITEIEIAIEHTSSLESDTDSIAIAIAMVYV
ncbi:hypothetical protein LXL04_010625 [Taraxacum kok-saghyz]